MDISEKVNTINLNILQIIDTAISEFKAKGPQYASNYDQLLVSRSLFKASLKLDDFIVVKLIKQYFDDTLLSEFMSIYNKDLKMYTWPDKEKQDLIISRYSDTLMKSDIELLNVLYSIFVNLDEHVKIKSYKMFMNVIKLSMSCNIK
jgi:hypothetical protein